MNEVGKMTYYAIDFETANDYPNSACSVGVVRFVDGIEQDSVYSLIKPPKMYFKPEYVNIHHISYGDVRNAPQFPEVWQTIIEPFVRNEKNENILFISHNADFDSNVLQACLDYYSMPDPNIDFACTLKIARQTWKNFKRYKLTFLADKFGIEYNAHNALDDARTCGKIFTLAAKESNTSLEDLFSNNIFCHFTSTE